MGTPESDALGRGTGVQRWTAVPIGEHCLARHLLQTNTVDFTVDYLFILHQFKGRKPASRLPSLHHHRVHQNLLNSLQFCATTRTASKVSMYTTTSSRARAEARAERESIVWRWEVRHGRGFVVRNRWFQMPIDPREYARWDIQHDALREAVGLWYQSYLGDLIPRMLGPRADGSAPRVVDIGTGSGKWAIEIAEAFPHAEVLGIDYQKPPINREIPVNCKFEQDDVNLGLGHYVNYFDIIHARVVDLGIDDYPGFLYDMAKILRQGGIIILFKPSMSLFQCHGKDERGEEIYVPMPEFGPKDDPPGYQLQKVLCLVDKAVKKRGGSEDAWMYYRELLEANPNFDKNSIRLRWLNVPVCLFPPRIPPEHLWICQLIEENFRRLCDSWTPVLIEDGYDPAEIQRWKQLVYEELSNKETKAYSRWTFAVATRGYNQWTSPPESRSPTNSSDSDEADPLS